jgi:phenylacetate-coenzyme A ligase PaaK-like adenylate-forming protein
MEITPLEGWMAQRLGIKRLSRELLEAYQLLKLQETISWARQQSPFYRERLADVGEQDLKTPADLARLPLTSADELRRDPLRFLCVSQGEVSRVVTLTTSGTSGAPKRLYFTPEDQERIIDFFHYGMSSMAGPGDRVLILLPGGSHGSQGDLLATGLRRLGAVGLGHGPVLDPRRTLEVMDRKRPEVIVGLPVQVLALARPGRGRAAPRAVVLCSDHTANAIRRELQLLWDCEVYTHYGMTEMGLGGGVECQAHIGYHLRELDLYLEIVDPHTGTPVKAGESGEVVFTTLSRRGMPLIRYRTGDHSRFLSEPCPCGTVLKTLETVKGRIQGVELDGTWLTMSDLDEALFPLEGLLDFTAVLSRAGDRNLLRLEVYGLADCSKELLTAAFRALKALPAISAACREDRLRLSVCLRANGDIPARGAAKRAILWEEESHDPMSAPASRLLARNA